MDHQEFDNHYRTVPMIFKAWMEGRLDLTRSTLLDFGCGKGIMALGMLHHCDLKRVVGVDINDEHKRLRIEASDYLNLEELPGNLEFHVIQPNEKLSVFFNPPLAFDCVFAWSVFEHVNQPNLSDMVRELFNTVRPGGYAFIQIDPLYYSPYGSHLETIISEPWGHLTSQLNLFKHRVVHADKQGPYEDEDDDNFEKIKASLWSTYKTLNKITADEIIALFTSNGFALIKEFRTTVDIAPPVSLTAVYNEDVLVTNQIIGLFQKKSGRPDIRSLFGNIFNKH